MFRRPPTMTPAEAAAALRRGELELVDVRGPAEVAEARVEGARHMPLVELAGRLGELDRGRPVAFLCRSGNRSAMAVRTAARAGYDARNVKGGIVAWARDGLPLTSDAARGAA
jgi:rhodanese-related sulfurtransferase